MSILLKKGIVKKGEELKLALFIEKYKDKICRVQLLPRQKNSKTPAYNLQYALLRDNLVVFNGSQESLESVRRAIGHEPMKPIVSFAKAYDSLISYTIQGKKLHAWWAIFYSIADLMYELYPRLFINFWNQFDNEKALKEWDELISQRKDEHDRNLSKERIKYLMELPSRESIDSAIKGFLTIQSQDFFKSFGDKLIVSKLRVESSDYILPTAPTKFRYTGDPYEVIKNLKAQCIFYYDNLPLADRSKFLSYCFNEWINPYISSKQLTFYAKKFAMLIDENYLTLGMVDDNKDIREFAQFVKKHERR